MAIAPLQRKCGRPLFPLHWLTLRPANLHHTGRRKIIQCGGSLRDVQELAGHASLATTQRYIAGDVDAKRRVVALI